MTSQWAEFERRTMEYEFHVLISTASQAEIFDECSRDPNRETGGILIGRYSENLTTALVTVATPPPIDSRKGFAWFTRGSFGLQALLARLWKHDRTQYLGEWHYHPFSAPQPSNLDKRSLAEVAKDSKYQCRAPILLIVGGDPRQREPQLYVGVYERRLDALIPLLAK